MRKRRSKAVFGLSLSRSFERLARSALRAGRKAMASAVTPGPPHRKAARRTSAPRRPAAAPRADRGWTHGIAAFGPVVRRYRLYRPPGLVDGAPLLVMLHGCGQDAAGFAAASRMNRVADREGFLVLYPEQDRLAHPNACWHWYDTRTGRAQAECGAIVAAVAQAVALQAADPGRVAVAGLSAGAGMAALLASREPGRFAAVAMHSGIAPGAAQSTATALAAMQGQRRPQLDATDLPPLLVIQGSADPVVRDSNGRDAASAWAAALGAKAATPRNIRRGARRPMRVSDFRRDGRVRVSLCEIDGLGHAWSGGAAGRPHTDPSGPDASRLVWTFVSRAFAAAAASAEGAAATGV